MFSHIILTLGLPLMKSNERTVLYLLVTCLLTCRPVSRWSSYHLIGRVESSDRSLVAPTPHLPRVHTRSVLVSVWAGRTHVHGLCAFKHHTYSTKRSILRWDFISCSVFFVFVFEHTTSCSLFELVSHDTIGVDEISSVYSCRCERQKLNPVCEWKTNNKE